MRKKSGENRTWNHSTRSDKRGGGKSTNATTAEESARKPEQQVTGHVLNNYVSKAKHALEPAPEVLQVQAVAQPVCPSQLLMPAR